jgi:hypothetical protein
MIRSTRTVTTSADVTRTGASTGPRPAVDVRPCGAVRDAR